MSAWLIECYCSKRYGEQRLSLHRDLILRKYNRFCCCNDRIKKIATENDIKLDNRICCTGGQAKNQSWLKLKSEIVGVPFFVGKCADAELMGNAAVACYGLGLYPSIKEAAEDLNKNL